MDRRLRLLLICLLVIISITLVTVLTAPKKESYIKGVSDEADSAVDKAILVFEEKKKAGVDFNPGPCLTNELMPNWALDVVHKPRHIIDEQPENQCPDYRSGKVKHLVELDPQGNLVRVK